MWSTLTHDLQQYNTIIWYWSLGYSWQKNNEIHSTSGIYCLRWTSLLIVPLSGDFSSFHHNVPFAWTLTCTLRKCLHCPLGFHLAGVTLSHVTLFPRDPLSGDLPALLFSGKLVWFCFAAIWLTHSLATAPLCFVYCRCNTVCFSLFYFFYCLKYFFMVTLLGN